MPLAMILKKRGHSVSGSDRSYDRNQSLEKFESLKNIGISLYPQDGSGVTPQTDHVVVSAAIEDSVPDIRAAKEKNISIKTRAEILSELFNNSPVSIGVAGTSGKSTVTGMIAHILSETGKAFTVMSGAKPVAADKELASSDADIFLSEIDESDGSIALYTPSISVLNNISLDHKPLEELKSLFLGFAERTTKKALYNPHDSYLPALLGNVSQAEAFLKAKDIEHRPEGVSFHVNGINIELSVPGQHNVENALASLSVTKALDIGLKEAAKALTSFQGVKRRLETLGTRKNITVIDDFAHNPDKIAASLSALKRFPGRLLVMFQPHGFTPLRLMGDEIIGAFADHLSKDDQLLMPEVYYAGGTVDRSVTAKDIVNRATEKEVNAYWFETRADIKPYILETAQSEDRIIIMGARDDTLTDFGMDILQRL